MSSMLDYCYDCGELMRLLPCATCGGTGVIVDETSYNVQTVNECFDCAGAGTIYECPVCEGNRTDD